jgi:DNA-directed RNA polymerase II subunit RPB1
MEMYDNLGIEAARQSIIREIRMILDVYGIYINHRHMITLTDLMSRSGEIRPVTRHGINRICEGPFRKASFEQTVE